MLTSSAQLPWGIRQWYQKYGDPVIRNVGGRVTPATLQTMGMLGEIAQREGGPPMGFHLVVLHHTQAQSQHRRYEGQDSYI